MTEKNYENPNATVRIKTPTERAREEAAKKTVMQATGSAPKPTPTIRTEIERRITEQLILHWHQCRNGNSYPTLKDIDLPALEEIWDDCLLVKIDDMEQQPNTYFFEHIGKNALAISGALEDTERSLLYIKEHLSSKYHFVFEQKRPHVEESELYDTQDNLVKYRQILLPIGKSDEEITHILIGLRHKIFAE